jgi:aspartyl-tRNA(Asn)/glutamyl-tRNA(Gln) amidotransferase subunit C
MPLSPEEVAHVAMLARLGLDDEERRRIGAELEAILAHIALIDAVDTSAVAETAQIGGLVNAWREDVAAPSQPRDAALGNAPDTDGDFFRVGAIQE